MFVFLFSNPNETYWRKSIKNHIVCEESTMHLIEVPLKIQIIFSTLTSLKLISFNLLLFYVQIFLIAHWVSLVVLFLFFFLEMNMPEIHEKTTNKLVDRFELDWIGLTLKLNIHILFDLPEFELSIHVRSNLQFVFWSLQAMAGIDFVIES